MDTDTDTDTDTDITTIAICAEGPESCGIPDDPAFHPGLWQLISPGLPIGAYAYSQGLESAVEAGWVRDAASAGDWVGGVLAHGPGRLDIPILLRMHAAWDRDDEGTVEHWSRFLLACRESRELLEEERHLGVALARLLDGLGLAEAEAWLDGRPVTLAAMFALAASRWEIPAHAAAQGYAWSWLENQVMAAVKLVPLGQTDGQRLLRQVGATLPGLVRAGATLADGSIGASLPGLQYASMRHERQHTRLFRS